MVCISHPYLSPHWDACKTVLRQRKLRSKGCLEFSTKDFPKSFSTCRRFTEVPAPLCGKASSSPTTVRLVRRASGRPSKEFLSVKGQHGCIYIYSTVGLTRLTLRDRITPRYRASSGP